MTYYAYANNFDPKNHSLALKFRLRVEGHTAWMTGEFYHRVIIEAKDIFKEFSGKWTKGGKYDPYASLSVHCCGNAREAAEYAASKYGLVLA